jgi:uncharacterized membrane protein
MVTLAREIYRELYAKAPEVLPHPSDVASWQATGTANGFVMMTVEYYTDLDPLQTNTVRHYI